MWELRHTYVRIKTVSWKFSIFNPYDLEVIALEICHLSLKNSLLFSTFSFNVNMESFQTIYQTDIL